MYGSRVNTWINLCNGDIAWDWINVLQNLLKWLDKIEIWLRSRDWCEGRDSISVGKWLRGLSFVYRTDSVQLVRWWKTVKTQCWVMACIPPSLFPSKSFAVACTLDVHAFSLYRTTPSCIEDSTILYSMHSTIRYTQCKWLISKSTHNLLNEVHVVDFPCVLFVHFSDHLDHFQVGDSRTHRSPYSVSI